MASVKLFHVTEFAESVFASPLAHRTSLHPLGLLLLAALWLATAGHWPLWQTLIGQTQAGAASPAILLALGFELLLFCCFWLALVAWPGVFRWGITVLLFWAALGCCLMWLQRESGEAVAVSASMLRQFLLQKESWGRLLNWPCAITLLLVAALPALLLWRKRIRRIPFMQRLLIIAIILIAVYACLAGVSGIFSHSLPSVLDPRMVLRLVGA
jgi:glucan phosphoethanolaminetransferase (alkaline phosphatase superfamily)